MIKDNYPSYNQESIAIIGMACRFPRATDLEQFWELLRSGQEGITHFSNEELLAEGISQQMLQRANYVKARGILPDSHIFDAAFFNISPHEAEMIDPQHCVFLECAWEALEMAGYDTKTYPGLIGIYGGSGINTYLYESLMPNKRLRISIGDYQLMLRNEKEFLTNWVSYKLNLTGPSLSIQTASATSLVAVHVACRSLLDYQCDMALAGGVSIHYPFKSGYLYEKGMILSPDGHCRAFDAQAQGTVPGDGVGIVVLKRLKDALVDGDFIHAVIRGSAVNHDGAAKVGYTALSVTGQAEVVARALAVADVEPDTVTYIETQGVGTPVGDAVELTALTQIYQEWSPKKHYCAIGSLEPNVGHLDAAGGVARLIKAILALKYQQLPPSLHCVVLNSNIDFASSPFYVNTNLKEWARDGSPRRAGVSCFGVGGTNAHVILEEAPASLSNSQSRPWHLLTLSAKTPIALRSATNRLYNHLNENSKLNLADVAYTLLIGRRVFNERSMVVCQDIADTITSLANTKDILVQRASYDQEKVPTIAFVLPSETSYYPEMGLGLYRTEPFFKSKIDLCIEFLNSKTGFRLNFESNNNMVEASLFNIQIRLFIIEYALAQLLLSWGILPKILLGQGVGQFVSACLAEVLSFEEVLLYLVKKKTIEDLNLSPPKIAFLSYRTGGLITPQEAMDAAYWEGLNKLVYPKMNKLTFCKEISECLALEIIPSGKAITVSNTSIQNDCVAVENPPVDENKALLQILGNLWISGVNVDWELFYQHEKRQRLALPTYPFERQNYWVNAEKSVVASCYAELREK